MGWGGRGRPARVAGPHHTGQGSWGKGDGGTLPDSDRKPKSSALPIVPYHQFSVL